MPAPSAGTSKLSLRAAMEARDLQAIVATFAPDAVLRSPLTSRLTFEGHDQIAAITAVILDVLRNFHYTAEVQSGDSAFLVWEAEVGAQKLQGVDHLRLDSDGLIAEFTVFFRPLPATAAALKEIGARLGRLKSPRRGALISILTSPLAFMTRTGDAVGAHLVKSAIGESPAAASMRCRPPAM